MRIGKHEWRIGVRVQPIGGKPERVTFYEWRRVEDRHGMCNRPAQAWSSALNWPTYNVNDGMWGGMPRGLRTLYEREAPTVRALMDAPEGYQSELTAAGEQLVIPGCQHNLAPQVRQLELFG